MSLVSCGSSSGRGRVLAVLGPTNTGKTFLAIERMLAHRSGMIGFPLRLLARENYDRIVAAKGRSAVALVTGEERIVPPNPSYFVCTVESMPLDRPVAFLAIDEIQLGADPERGHVFTDRLLRARGTEETMFLGADTVRPLVQSLVRGVELIGRPRFSSLSYAGHRKLTRLPPRSAVVAFSAADVYALAEQVRRQRGGAAVVLGALSPRTRNAQVALYQAGEVDYLVATDAIGMGLNMDVDHVAFARLVKFDGQSPRRLRAPEIAQIAGRAGRHMNDGTFGITAGVEALEPELIDAVESHRFATLQTLLWRNTELCFDSPPLLLKSLERRPAQPELRRVGEADDQQALTALARDPEVAARARGRHAVALLWDVCQIPDFRKVLSDVHVRLLGQVYRFLTAEAGRLPEDWVDRQVARLDRVEGDIDALVTRIAHVRTWTYISHRPDWLADPSHWQERSRGLEDRLSDALHERLTQRFVDRRSASLVKTLQSGAQLLSSVGGDGDVKVEGHHIGRLDGFRFLPDTSALGADSRALVSAARRSLRREIAARVRRLEEVGDAELPLGADGLVRWEDAPVARLVSGAAVLGPAVVLLHDELLEGAQRERVRRRIQRRIEGYVGECLSPLVALRDAALAGAARGLAFQLVEALGTVPRAALASLIAVLSKADRQALYRLGVRLGASHVFLPALVKPHAVAARALLWAVHRGVMPLPLPVPPPGRVSVPVSPEVPASFHQAIGYPRAGPLAVRVDMLDRLERDLHRFRDAAGLKADLGLAQLIGCAPEHLDQLLIGLGYRRGVDVEGAAIYRRRPPQRHRDGAEAGGAAADSPFAKLKEIELAR